MTPANLGRTLVVLIIVLVFIGTTADHWRSLWAACLRSKAVRTLGPLWSVVFVIEATACLLLTVGWHRTGLTLCLIAVVVACAAIWYDADVRGGNDAL